MDIDSPSITAGRFRVVFPEDIPRYSTNNSPFLKAILNGYNPFIPNNEL